MPSTPIAGVELSPLMTFEILPALENLKEKGAVLGGQEFAGAAGAVSSGARSFVILLAK
jgi:hypothetical protein